MSSTRWVKRKNRCPDGRWPRVGAGAWVLRDGRDLPTRMLVEPRDAMMERVLVDVDTLDRRLDDETRETGGAFVGDALFSAWGNGVARGGRGCVCGITPRAGAR